MAGTGRSAWWVSGAVVLAVGVLLYATGQAAMAAVQRYPKPRVKSVLDGASIVAALSKLEAQQEEVLRRLEAAKKELDVVKVRAATIPSGICN